MIAVAWGPIIAIAALAAAGAVVVAFIGWIIYDCGFDRGWDARDKGRSR